MSGFSAAKISGCGEQHADGPAGLTFDAADEVQPFLVLGVGAVAEVEPQDVSTGVKESADGAKVRAGGAERGDYRGVAKAAHGVLKVSGTTHKPRAPDARKPPSTGIAMPVT